MKPYYQDNHITINHGSCLNMDIPKGTIQCVVTSPPYWGLRKYEGDQELVWGGDSNCEHDWITETRAGMSGGMNSPKLQSRHGSDNFQAFGSSVFNTCQKCGAWKGAYGLEPTPELYVEHTVEILREIKRVLRKDGVVFWNIGDSYSGGHRKSNPKQTISGEKETGHEIEYTPSRDITHESIKPKDLCLIPFRVAIAAQEDGWWVRSVIIWNKPNPMPESVKDRPTNAHEYILMLTKSKNYYWDIDAVRVPHKEAWNVTSWEDRKARGEPTTGIRHINDFEKTGGRGQYKDLGNPAGRNLRDVWTFPTQPFPEAHFAVFPEKLPETCIKAATPEVGCCSKCGKPWERITEISRVYKSGSGKAGNKPSGKWRDHPEAIGDLEDDIRAGPCISSKTLGWKPACKCNADKVPSIVLDPFMGSGTTLKVASYLQRKAIGYDISLGYCEMARDRCKQGVLV